MKEIIPSLPREILEWKSEFPDRLFDRQTIYDYLDGGAEMYLAFDFRNTFVRQFKSPDKQTIVLDIYDMGSAPEAFGVFSIDRQDPETRDYGQGSTYSPGLLRFWKDRYFISISAIDDDKKAEPALLRLAQAVGQAIPSKGSLPPGISRLPREGLLENRISCFHDAISLNNRFFIASENILKLSPKTGCLLAEYRSGSEKNAVLLQVGYETAPLAEAAFSSFSKAFMPEAGAYGIVKTENGKWTLAKKEGKRIILLFEAPTREWGIKLLTEIKGE